GSDGTVSTSTRCCCWAECPAPCSCPAAKRSVESGTGVRETVARQKPLRGDVRVDLRRAQAGMAQDLLNRTQVGSAVEQMRRGGMPKGVRSDGRTAGDIRKG